MNPIQKIIEEQRKQSKIHKLTDGQINKTIANKEKAQDPVWLEATRRASRDPSNKQFLSEHSKEKWQDPEFRERALASRKASWANDEDRRQKVVEQFKGKSKPDSQKEKMSKSGKAYWGSEEGQAKKQEILNRPEVRAAISNTHKGKPKIKKACVNCGDVVAVNVMDRFHGNNCVFKSKHVAAYEGKQKVKTYSSYSQFREDTLNWEFVSKCLKGEKESYKGYTFKWVKK